MGYNLVKSKHSHFITGFTFPSLIAFSSIFITQLSLWLSGTLNSFPVFNGPVLMITCLLQFFFLFHCSCWKCFASSWIECVGQIHDGYLSQHIACSNMLIISLLNLGFFCLFCFRFFLFCWIFLGFQEGYRWLILYNSEAFQYFFNEKEQVLFHF